MNDQDRTSDEEPFGAGARKPADSTPDSASEPAPAAPEPPGASTVPTHPGAPAASPSPVASHSMDSQASDSDPLAGVPMPDGAPEPGACVKYLHPEPGLVQLVIDPPHRSMPVFDKPVLRDLAACVDRLETEGSVRGLVISGRDAGTFLAGADLDSIAMMEAPEAIARYIAFGQDLFQRIHKLSKAGGGSILSVAAIGGPVPGGAYELSLACDRIVLTDDDRSKVGLPEVKLGIVPGWGGCARLPRRAGVPTALDVILNGKLVRARKAKQLGMVDRLTKPEYLVRVAADVAMGRKPLERASRGKWAWLVDKNPLALAVINRAATKKMMAATGGHYPAPQVALDLVLAAPRESLTEALAAERRVNSTLATNPITRALMGIFHMSEDAKLLARDADGDKAPGFERGAVIGAGVMGGAIASLAAERGMELRLRDLSRDALDSAERAHQKELAKKRKRRWLRGHEADAALDRLETTTEPIGFGSCEFVIEAVAEKLEVKHAVFGELTELLPDGAILATNTSSLSVGEIAAALPDPSRVVGLHFFNPVRRMPLVEIVRGPETSEETVRRMARLALDLGKTPVVVKDVPGFLVNRLLAPYLDEALCLVADGAAPERIDRALEDFGMPMGPLELIDEVGLDIAAHAGASMHAGYGPRMTPSTFLAPLLENGDLGKKTGAGIYRYDDKGGRPKKAGLNPRLPAAESNRAIALTTRDFAERCILAMVNEGARAIDDGVTENAGQFDLATIFGMGFAPFRGGLLAYADSVGPDKLIERLRAMQQQVQHRPGGPERFEPAPALIRLAETGKTFHEVYGTREK